jgi:hypothetical protein
VPKELPAGWRFFIKGLLAQNANRFIELFFALPSFQNSKL